MATEAASIATSAAMPRPFLPPCDGTNTHEDVHVFAPAKIDRKDATAQAIVRVLRPPPIFGVGIAMLVAMVLVRYVDHLINIPLAVGMPVILVLFAAPMTWWMIARRVPKAPKNAAVEPAKRADESYRIRLMATKDQAHAIGPLQDEPFEPVVAPIYFALRGPKGAAIVIWVVVSLALCAGYWALKRHLGLFGGSQVMFYEWWACFGLASAPLAVLWPTYLRVSPGRLDVFEYGVLGSGVPRVRTFDLREHRVTLNIVGNMLTLERGEGEKSVIHWSGWMPRKFDLARSILEAARWKHARAALPDDQLVG